MGLSDRQEARPGARNGIRLRQWARQTLRALFGFEGLEAAHRVDGGGEAGVGRHLDEHFAKLLDGEPDIAGGVQVDIELGFAAAFGGEHGDGGEFAVAQGEAGAGVDVAEGVLDDVAAEVAE